nr:thiol reductant ABC exporter subunit CydC [Corynebacterium lactis]
MSGLRETIRDLRTLVWPGELVGPTVAGTVTLISALSLTIVSAWLITRSWQMPPLMEITVAVTAVRALGISRAAFRYVDRLAAHSVALGTAERSRIALWRRFSSAPGVAGRSRAEVAGALGGDIDALADVVVRSLIPALIALATSLFAVVFAALLAPLAAAVLAVGLALAGLVAPYLIYRAASATTAPRASALRDHAGAVEAVLYDAPGLRIRGHLDEALRGAEESTRRIAALDRASGRAAGRASTIATGAAALTAVATVVVGALLLGGPGEATHSPEWLTVLVLIPLAAFESVGALPAAAQTLGRFEAALHSLAEGHRVPGDVGVGAEEGGCDGSGPNLVVRDLVVGYGGRESTLGPWNFDLPFGSYKEITAPSGTGKTTLLKTLAGLIPPISGSMSPRPDPSLVRFIAEDEHVFATTVRDNIAVGNPQVGDATITDVLQRLGLADWVAGLPEGLDTILTAGDGSLSGGQRRRLILARALVSSAPILLLDEPTEHLESEAVLEILRDTTHLPGSRPLRSIVIVRHPRDDEEPGEPR